MRTSSRRDFLSQSALASAALISPTSVFGLFHGQSAPTSGPIRAYIDSRRTLSALDRNIFGSFLEHLGRAIYEGIYDPSNKLSDENGFRLDVLKEIQQLNVPIIRYPGGNFVSGYHWLDGVGPKQDRPTVLEKAWDSLETNQFGTNEFLAWCKLAGTQPLLAVNLGTGTAESAAALVEYCNLEKGTEWSDLRRKHGIEKAYAVKNWCLGNEMDGPWQIGHMSASEYGLKAADAARQMRYVDPSLNLIACGSSGPTRPSYLEWDREVLEECYDYVDAISLHRYFDNTSETGGDSSKFLALNLSMEQQIAEVAAVCDMVRGRRHAPKKLWLSFDEWNVWYRARDAASMDGKRKPAPHLLEEPYNLEDALLVGGIVNSLLRNSDRVRIGCLAQLVNVIAPLMTNASSVLRQTIFYPYSWALQYARGASLEVQMENSPTYEISANTQASFLDVAGTLDSAAGTVSVFVLNRDVTNTHQLELHFEGSAGKKPLASQMITGMDLKARNTFDAPRTVLPITAPAPTASGDYITIEAPPRSYSVYQWSL